MNFKTKAKQNKEVHATDKFFPRLMIDPDSLSVYMMTGLRSGMKLHQGETGINKRISVGTVMDRCDSQDMIDYNGTLKINTL